MLTESRMWAEMGSEEASDRAARTAVTVVSCMSESCMGVVWRRSGVRRATDGGQTSCWMMSVQGSGERGMTCVWGREGV